MRNLLKIVNFSIIRNLIKKIIPVFSRVLKPVKAFTKKHYEIINPIFVLTVICLIVAAALSLTNSLTAAKVEAINLQNTNNEMAALIPADSYSELTAQFEDVEWAQNYSGTSIYEAKTNDTLAGYLVTNSAKGYGGEILVMTAFNPDNSVKGISILASDDETPGLGQNINTQDFCSRFSGLTTDATVVKESPDISKGEIKAITGATISSKGVVNAVNSARAALNAYLNTPGLNAEDGTPNQDEPQDTTTSIEENGGGTVEE